MPSFNVQVPHSLGQDAAKARMDSFLETMEKKYKDQISDMDGSWSDNILNFSFNTDAAGVAHSAVLPNVVHKRHRT